MAFLLEMIDGMRNRFKLPVIFSTFVHFAQLDAELARRGMFFSTYVRIFLSKQVIAFLGSCGIIEPG